MTDQQDEGPPARVPTREGPLPTLQALGDSTAAGVGARAGSYVDRLRARMARAGRSLRLVNLGQSGATTGEVLTGQVPRMAPGPIGLVVVGVGVNDLTRGVPPEIFAQRFEAVISAVRERTAAPIVVSNLPDVSLARAVWPDLRPALAARVDGYNAAIARVADKHGLSLFDTCAMTRQELPTHPEYLSGDGFHPSDQGYQAWGDGLWRIVRRLP